MASRRLVLTLSPGRFGISDGAPHHAFEAKALDLTVHPVSGRPCLVAERQPLVFGGELAHQLRRRRRRVLDLAVEADLTASTALRDGNRITQLRCIEADESFAMINHDSPSLREALPGLSG